MIHTNSQPERYLTHFTNGEQIASSDATSDNGGCNRGFRPHELLEAALAACMNMTLRMYAQKHGIPVVSTAVCVSLNRGAPDGPTFMYRAEVYGSLSDAQRQQLLASLESCPVRTTLSKRASSRKRPPNSRRKRGASRPLSKRVTSGNREWRKSIAVPCRSH